jgi:hypothetical protein
MLNGTIIRHEESKTRGKQFVLHYYPPLKDPSVTQRRMRLQSEGADKKKRFVPMYNH